MSSPDPVGVGEAEDKDEEICSASALGLQPGEVIPSPATAFDVSSLSPEEFQLLLVNVQERLRGSRLLEGAASIPFSHEEEICMPAKSFSGTAAVVSQSPTEEKLLPEDSNVFATVNPGAIPKERRRAREFTFSDMQAAEDKSSITYPEAGLLTRPDKGQSLITFVQEDISKAKAFASQLTERGSGLKENETYPTAHALRHPKPEVLKQGDSAAAPSTGDLLKKLKKDFTQIAHKAFEEVQDKKEIPVETENLLMWFNEVFERFPDEDLQPISPPVPSLQQKGVQRPVLPKIQRPYMVGSPAAAASGMQMPGYRSPSPAVQRQVPMPVLPRAPVQVPRGPAQVYGMSPNIPPLSGESRLKCSGENYNAWTIEISTILRREGTYHMVFGPPPQPWTPELSDLDVKACTTLMLSMETDLQALFPPEISAQDIWAQLEMSYRPISEESACFLLSDFHNTKIKPGERIGGHLTKLKKLRKDVIDAGYYIDDMLMRSVIINSLTPEWKDAIAKVNQIPADQRSVEFVCRLLMEEEKILLRSAQTPKVPVRRYPEGRSFVPRTTRCQTCDRVGHTSKDCSQRSSVPDQPRGKDSRGRGRGSRGQQRHEMSTLVLASAEEKRSILWLLDSGAALHTTFRKELFTELYESDIKELYSYSNHRCPIEGKGTVFIPELNCLINNVYYIPTANKNLLSQSHLSKDLGFQVHHLKEMSYIEKDGERVADIIDIDGVYFLKPKPRPRVKASINVPIKGSTGPERNPGATPRALISKNKEGALNANVNAFAHKVKKGVQTPKVKIHEKHDEKCFVKCNSKVPHSNAKVKQSLTSKCLHYRCIHRWHRRMGHLDFKSLLRLPSHVKGVKYHNCKVFLNCSVCKAAESSAEVVPDQSKCKSTRIFELVHADLVGPFRPSVGGNVYMLTLLDDYTRYGYVYTMKEKSDIFQIFKDFSALVYNQFGVQIARIQSDRGDEFESRQFQSWMQKNRILHLTAASHTSICSGVAERRQKVLQNMMHCFLEDANLVFSFWSEAVKYANYLANRTWDSVINQTPFFQLFGFKPDLRNVRIFGSFAMVHIPYALRRKGDPLTERLRFMGFDECSKYSKFSDSNNKLVISQSAEFEEDANWSRIHLNDPGRCFPRDSVAGDVQSDDGVSQVSDPDSNTDISSSQITDAEASDGEERIVIPRRSKRSTKGVPPRRYAGTVDRSKLPLLHDKASFVPKKCSHKVFSSDGERTVSCTESSKSAKVRRGRPSPTTKVFMGLK